MDKVKLSDKNITPFGGLNFIFRAFKDFKIDKLIDNQLGTRSIYAQYSHSDVVFSLFGNALCQGSFIADLEILKAKFSNQFFNKIPSPDTVEYVCQALKSPNKIVISENEVEHQLNYNQGLNEFLTALSVKTKQLKKGVGYTLDFDNVVIATNKAYHPNISFIGRNIVHLENHNGNTPASFQQKESLKRCFDNLDKSGIKIENFRADSASCQKEVFEEVENRATYFFVRAKRSQSFRDKCGQIETWKTATIGFQEVEIGTMNYPFGVDKKEYKVVVTRFKTKDSDKNLFEQSTYTYQGIVTNDDTKSEQEIIEFYNKRGDSEKSNCYLLNDFNFRHLPFMDMDTNTVYMYLMAMCSILFEWLKQVLVNNKTNAIALTMRTKAVCFRYIVVASKFTIHARKKIITLFSKQNYEILQV